MQVSFENTWFLCRDAWEFKDKLKSEGFMYLPNQGNAWGTRSWREAFKYKKYFTPLTQQIINSVSIRKINDGLGTVRFEFDTWDKLDPSQKDGARFAMTRNHSYMAFEAGVGKTATAIMSDFLYAKIYNYSYGSLYIVPPNLITNWVNEIKIWWPNARVETVRSHDDVDVFDGRPDIILCADSLFVNDRRLKDKPIVWAIKQNRFRTIVIDEAHRFINLDAERTREVFSHDRAIGQGIVHQADKVILLSGTHMRRGPINLYAPVFGLAWNLINFLPHNSFGVRYCNGHRRRVTRHREVWDFKGSSREDELHKRLYGKFILEKDLKLEGKKIERVITLDYSKSPKIAALEKAILKKKTIEEIIGSKELGAIAEYRNKLAAEKVKASYDYISDALQESDKPSAIFCIHHHTIDLLMKAFEKYRPKEISGRIKMREREKIGKDFQSGKCKLIIWQVHTAYGVNAQKGERCFFVESPWSPDDIDQAIHRFYRRGQKNNVVADHLLLANTLDQYVLKTCLDKKETINKVRKGVSI